MCDSSCSQCFNSSANKCVTCPNTKLLQNYNCVSTCGTDYFLQDNKACAPCTYPCSSCVNYESCTSCKGGYLLFAQRCIRQCPIYYFADSFGVCQGCSSNCKSCFNSSSCIACANDFVLFEGICVIETPCLQRVGYYYDDKVLKCLACP